MKSEDGKITGNEDILSSNCHVGIVRPLNWHRTAIGLCQLLHND